MGELGIYHDFPPFTHLDIRFSTRVPTPKTIALITGGIGKLNDLEERVNTWVAGRSGMFSVDRTFEVGIAEGLYFNYLDKREVERISKLSPPPSTIDFIVYINYRYLKRDKVVSLLSDRYLLRVSVDSSSIKVFQMGGLRRTAPEDLITTIIGSINSQAKSSGSNEDVLIVQG
nr:hypothetical protein [Candidatus Njordarchaeota archaeon]